MSTESPPRSEEPAAGAALPGAFGLAISSDAGLPGIEAPAAVAGSRAAVHRLVEGAEIEARLAGGELSELGEAGGGRTRIAYRQHTSGATLIRTASFGDHLLADGGRLLLSAVGGAEKLHWQRYLLGQLLPLTASVQGLEVFHAGAVAVDGGVLALAGPSGAGKSSVAAALMASGAAFFSDDVLALAATPFELTAYPGPALIGIPHDLPPAVVKRLPIGRAWASDGRKLLGPVVGERRALPVRAFVRLTPDERAVEPSFGRCLPDRLMATTFDGVSRAPERLLRLLRVAAQLAATGSALELRYRPGTDPRLIAAALLDQLGTAAVADERVA